MSGEATNEIYIFSFHDSPLMKYEACIRYFGIRDIGLLFLRDTGIFVFFLFWDMGYSGILGHVIL